MFQTLRNIFNEALPLLAILFLATAFPQRSGWLFLAAFIITVFRFSAFYAPGDGWLFFTGAIVGYIFEVVLNLSGMYAYNKAIDGVPLLNLFIWGLGFILLDRVLRLRFFSEQGLTPASSIKMPPNLVVAIEALCLFLGAWLAQASVFFGTLFLVLVLMWRLMRDPRFTEIILVVGAAVLGIIVEAVLVNSGLYSFATKHFWGLPIYLPLIWGLQVLIFAHLVRKVRDPMYHL